MEEKDTRAVLAVIVLGGAVFLALNMGRKPTSGVTVNPPPSGNPPPPPTNTPYWQSVQFGIPSKGLIEISFKIGNYATTPGAGQVDIFMNGSFQGGLFPSTDGSGNITIPSTDVFLDGVTINIMYATLWDAQHQNLIATLPDYEFISRLT